MSKHYRYRTHNEKVSKAITEDAAAFLSAEISDFVIELRNELEEATPVDTGHGALNWLIRKSASNKEYGKRSFFPAHKEKRNYNQPTLTPIESGEDIAKNFDIRQGRGNLTVFNNVDYIIDINEGTHVVQSSKWRKPKLRDKIGFIEKTIARVEGKYGF